MKQIEKSKNISVSMPRWLLNRFKAALRAENQERLEQHEKPKTKSDLVQEWIRVYLKKNT